MSYVMKNPDKGMGGGASPAEDLAVATIGSAIARRAAAAADSAALVGVGCPTVSFSQLLSSISAFAGQLASAGLRREDRVGLLVPADVAGGQLVVALACNVTLVPVNPALTVHEMMEVCKASGLRAIVIPGWLDTPARSALLEQGVAVLEAGLVPDGSLSLQALTPAIGPSSALRPACESDVALLLRSSGTTGAPKFIPVTHGNLLAMAAKLGSDLWFKLGPQDRAACTSPLYYAAGLKTSLFVPLILGAGVGFPPAGRTLDLAEWLDVLKPTYLSVAPGALNGILGRLRATGHGVAGHALRFVMCGSAYLAEDVRLNAQSVLGVPVLEFYGLSEAGVMAANPVPPGRNKPGTVGLPAPGELLVVDENRNPVGAGAVGQIAVSGPSVTPGYASTGGCAPDDLKDGWMLTGDLGRIDEDGYLTIVGRVKEVINRGGEKVFPYEIEKAMLEHPAVLEAAAFGVPHPRLGESVAAAVVSRPDSRVSEQELKEFLAARVAGFKLPRRISFVPALPRGNTGKVLRSALSDAHAAGRHELVEPNLLFELELRDLWARLLRTDDIGIDDDFFEKGGDSLLATEMLMEVEALAGKPYPQSELAILTIRHIVDVVSSGLSTERDLITQVKRGSGMPFFFCHGDYATRGIYAHRLAALLPADQPVFLLHCDAQSLVGSSVEEIAHAYLPEVLRVAPGSPVLVGGYCNGGLAAWHLARLLRSRGVEVLELLLIETMSLNARPGLRRLPGLVATTAGIMPGRAGKLLREDGMRAIWMLARTGVTGFAGTLYRAARRKFLPALQQEQESESGFRRDTHRTYYRLLARDVPPPLDVSVTCFIAQEGRHFDTDPGFWRSLAPRVTEVRVPGTHHSALISHRQALAAAITDALKRATSERRPAQLQPRAPPERNERIDMPLK